MNLFSAVLYLHIACVVVSVSLFTLRYWWTYSGNARLNQRWVRIAPHCSDTLLFLSGAGLMAITHYLPFTEDGSWLTEKLFGVIITSHWVLSRWAVVARAASRAGLLPFCWLWWCCSSSYNSPLQEHRYWGKS